MDLTELFLNQLDREIESTRRCLESLPDRKGDWKPHSKSMQLGYLASLVASMPSWITMMIEEDSLDLASGGPPSSRQDRDALLELFDDSVASAKNSLKGTTDQHLLTGWKLKMGEHVVDDRPRHLQIADTFMHLSHHRGQLSVYLRLNDRPVPSIYGPSADQSWTPS